MTIVEKSGEVMPYIYIDDERGLQMDTIELHAWALRPPRPIAPTA